MPGAAQAFREERGINELGAEAMHCHPLRRWVPVAFAGRTPDGRIIVHVHVAWFHPSFLKDVERGGG